jgi:hypothetical protein
MIGTRRITVLVVMLSVVMVLLSAKNERVTTFCEYGVGGREGWEMFCYMSHTSIQPINININKQCAYACVVSVSHTLLCWAL